MPEKTEFLPLDNLFLLNSRHEQFLTGENRHFQDFNVWLSALGFGALIIIYLGLELPVLQALMLHISLTQSGVKLEFPDSWIIITLLYFGALIAYIYAIIHHVLRNRLLERDGTLIIGQLVKVEGAPDRQGYRIMIHYTFQSPEGVELTRREERVRSGPNNKLLPTIGIPVVVVYVNPKVFRVL